MSLQAVKIDFVGIGAPRSGTTWIAKCLMEHPEISFPYAKELNYFSKTRANKTKSEYEISGINGYLSLFKSVPSNKVKGEYSTYYLADPNAAKLIKKHFPNIKIIVSLREPVERAYSDYGNIKLSDLEEKDSFEKAFNRKGMGLDSYKDRGMYFEQLKEYYKLFPKKNIHVIIYDDIKKNPGKVMHDLYKFLGVNSNFNPPSLNKKENPQEETKFKPLRYVINTLRRITNALEKLGLGKAISFTKRVTKINKLFNNLNKMNKKEVKEESKEKLSPELKKKLKKVYAKDIKQLEKLINRNLRPWK